MEEGMKAVGWLTLLPDWGGEDQLGAGLGWQMGGTSAGGGAIEALIGPVGCCSVHHSDGLFCHSSHWTII